MYIAQMSSCLNVFAYIIIKGLWHTGKISGMGTKLPDCQKVQVFPKIKKAHPFSQHSSCPWESVFFSAVEGGAHLPKDPVLRHCRSGCSRYHCESPFAFPHQGWDQDGMAILYNLADIDHFKFKERVNKWIMGGGMCLQKYRVWQIVDARDMRVYLYNAMLNPG